MTALICSLPKRCSRCKETKALEQFYFRQKEGKHYSWCRSCCVAANGKYKEKSSEWSKRQRATNPAKWKEKGRHYTLKARYGLSREMYYAMVAEQNGCCALCQATEPRGRGEWAVDHDHKTGVIRGLLCFPCNIRIGVYEGLKDVFGVDKVEDYLASNTGYLMKKRKIAS